MLTWGVSAWRAIKIIDTEVVSINKFKQAAALGDQSLPDPLRLQSNIC